MRLDSEKIIRHSLCKRQILRGKNQFDRILKVGRRYVSPPVTCIFTEAEAPFNRIGIIVTRKNKRAISRNRWKRTIKEYWRTHHTQLQCHPLDLVVIVTRKSVTVPKNQVHATVTRTLSAFMQKMDN